MRSCMRCCSNYSTVSKEKYKFISTQWRYWRTLVAWIDSSNSPIHEEAKEEFSVSLVAASILYRIFDETSTGIALLGRCSGIGNAIRNARHKPAWRSGEQRQECALCVLCGCSHIRPRGREDQWRTYLSLSDTVRRTSISSPAIPSTECSDVYFFFWQL